MTSRILYNSPDGTGALAAAYHYEMVSDHKRVGAFSDAIERVCRERVVLESGTGTGILALLAARSGARFVYAVEADPAIADVARRNFAASGYPNIELLEGDIFSVTTADLGEGLPEVIIAENLSTWEVEEPEIEVMAHINATLAPSDAIRLPTRIMNCLELVESTYSFHDLVEIRTLYFQFTGVQPPRSLSARAQSLVIELDRCASGIVEVRTEVAVLEAGVANSLRLTSPIEIFPGTQFDTSDSLMPPVVVPLKSDLHVSRGDRVEVEIIYTPGAGWDRFECTAVKRLDEVT